MSGLNIASNMLLSAMIGALLSVTLLSSLIVGDPTTVITMNSAKSTNWPNDYIDPWIAEIVQTKKGSQVTIYTPTKKELPENMKVKINGVLNGDYPFEYITTLCDGLSNSVVTSNLAKAGRPKDEYPKECPIGIGNFTVWKWEPPANLIPPGVPEGPFSGTCTFYEDDKPPYALIDFEGEISHALPVLRR